MVHDHCVSLTDEDLSILSMNVMDLVRKFSEPLIFRYCVFLQVREIVDPADQSIDTHFSSGEWMTVMIINYAR